MSFGYDPELPAGFQDADIEMAELTQAAESAQWQERRNHEIATAIKSEVTTEKDMAMKDGTTIAKGAAVWYVLGKPEICLVQGARPEPYRVRCKNAFKTFEERRVGQESNAVAVGGGK